jgi:hypothetical protein
MPDLSGIQFVHSTIDRGERRPRQRIDAVLGDQRIGHLEWHGVTHRITTVGVDFDHTRQGIATHMWNMSQQMRPKARHSPDRTTMGDAWARSVGGHLPRRIGGRATKDYGDDDWDAGGNPVRR